MSSDAREGALPKSAYRSYIQSEAWRKKCQLYLQSKLPKVCVGCKVPYSKGFHLHHRSYKNLGVERLMDLVLLCPSCHSAIHDDPTRNLWKHTKKVLKVRNR